MSDENHVTGVVDERRARRLPRAERERQILDAAVRVFARYGYHSASMDEIAEEAGISKPMVYAYLGSKEDLFTACIRRETGRLMEAIAAGVSATPSPDMSLWQGLLAFFTYVAQGRDSWLVLHRQARSQGGPFADELAEARLRAIELIASLLAQRAGEASGDTAGHEGRVLAAALVGAAESMADWWLDNPDSGTARTFANRLMNLVWMGFGDLVEGRLWQRPAD